MSLLKKVFLSVSLFTFLGVVKVNAQKFTGGLIGGLSTSQVSGDNLAGFSQYGLILGGLTELKLSEKFSAQFEIMYIQKGSRSSALDTLTYYRLKLHYMEVLVLIRYHYKKIALEFGPSIAFFLGSKEENEYGEVEPKTVLPFNKIELSANLGLNYPLYQNLFVNIRLEQSVTPIRPFQSQQTTTFNKGQYNSLINYSLRYYFNSSK
jgi:hypothetical protein